MYDQKHFAANPRKYTMYKTAIVASDVVTSEGKTHLPKGLVVGITFRGIRWNHATKRNEPTYAVNGLVLYASCFEAFVL